MLEILIALVVGGIGGVLIGAHWDKVVAELKKIAAAISKLAKLTWTASKTIIRNVAQGTAEVVNTLFYEDSRGKINQRVTVIEDIPESQLPDWAKAELRAKRGEVDITKKSREMLTLEL